MNCVAATQSDDVRALLRDVAPWLPNLTTCATGEGFLSAVAHVRPDVALVGPGFDEEDFASLGASLATSGLGLALVGPGADRLAARLNKARGTARAIHVEPFDPRTDAAALVFRLRALLRRCRPAALARKHAHGDMILDEEALTLAMDGRVAPLSLEGFRILAPFFDDPKHVWSRQELLSLVYGTLTKNAPRTVDAKLSITRRGLMAALGRDPIRTIRGQGYALAMSR